MVSARPRIFLIHALRLSMDPVLHAFKRRWPEAEPVNLLEDSLSTDRARAGLLEASMVERFRLLGRYAQFAQADAVLFTCSAFGKAIDAVAQDLSPLPVMKPYEGVIAQVSALGKRVGMLASFRPTFESIAAEFPPHLPMETAYCSGALEALQAGDGIRHDQIVADTAATLRGCSAIVLMQFSMARAAEAVAGKTGLPVLTTPDCAVTELYARMTNEREDSRLP